MLVRHRLDSQGHPCGGVQRRRQSKVVELLNLLNRWHAAFSAFADSAAWDHRRLGRVSGDLWRTEQTARAELAPMSVTRADRSGRLEAVPLDSQLFDLRFERLPGYAQLGRSTGRPPDDALRLS